MISGIFHKNSGSFISKEDDIHNLMPNSSAGGQFMFSNLRSRKRLPEYRHQYGYGGGMGEDSQVSFSMLKSQFS